MEIKRVELRDCTLNLGELHRLKDYGFFNPVFHCRAEDGDEFVARMKLHITEPLDKLVIVDPRAFSDGGYETNSSNSKILKRMSSYADMDSGSNPVLNPTLLDGKSLYEISASDIKNALLNGYNFRQECNKSRQVQNKELKIAFTCHDPQIIGGGNIILFRYINWLADLGVKVTIYSCGHHPSWIRVKAKFCNFSTYSEMFSAIEEDVVVLYSMWHIEPMLKASPKGKRIYHLRQIYEPFHYGKNSQSMLARKPAIELLESLPLGVISVSPHLHEWYKKKLGIESLLVTNGIKVQVFYPSARKKPKSNRKRIVSVGSPRHFVKGAAVLADSLRLVAKRKPDMNFEWTIACGQKENIRSNEMLGRNLELIIKPGLSHAQMRELYQRADVVVNPSLYEGYGLPTLEAMACNVPVVQADNRGLDFIIEDGRNCLVVPINDSARMAEAIEKILTDEQLADRIRIEGFRTAKKYSTLNQYEMFIEAFEDILHTTMPVEKVDLIRNRLNVKSTEENILDVSRADIQAPDEKEPLVSVVIPSYNQAGYLREALDSLLAQTYPHWEAIVVNDGSTDNTAEVLSEYAQRDSRIKPVNKTNGGITNALNDGLKHCNGDYFCWLSSDDLYYPEKLEVLIKAFKSLGDDYALVYGSFDLLQEETHKIDVRPFAEPVMSGAEFPEPLKFDFIDGCSMMIRMDVMREVDGFNHYYRHSQDLELWMRIASRGYRFHLVDKKVTIRRVHIEQSSTINMIHCRYDAARMVNYYLEHFHLLEMYRYFNFTLDDDVDRFVEHFVGRMLHTEACVNHPLIQEKFWRWFEHGLTALAPDIQNNILKKCLSLLMNNRSVTYKMKYYIKECLASLSKERDYVSFAPDFSIDGRDIRYHNYDDDKFVKALFDYGTDLLINENTPLFAQELYFHNTNKVVDTPFKLAHSVFRYLSQFPNPYLNNVEPYVDITKIPATQDEAIKLFVLLRYPEYSDAFQKSLAFDAEKNDNLDGVEEHEKIISQMPQKYKEDLQEVCSKNPTITILHYWNALALAEEGRFAEALTEGWKTLTLNHRSCDWRIAYRLGIWAEKANDFKEAMRAYSMGYGCNASFLPFIDGMNRVSQIKSLSQYKPIPKQFIFTKEYSDVPNIILSDCKVSPLFDGNYILGVNGISKNGETFDANGILSYSENLKNIRFTDPYTNKRVTISASSIFNLWSGGYDFVSEAVKSYKKLLKNNDKISVAFTIRNSSTLGGGSLILYRYINWLSTLGVDVAVYSDDIAPTWADIKARFYHIKDDVERYSSIAEPVVVVYSVLELPALLRHCKTKEKRIYHLCQAVEDFHHYGPTFDSSIAPKPIFEILHSLPVGRLAVSTHIQDYFYEQYGQRAHTIVNGIDLNNYMPRWKCCVNDRINVLIVGNPKRLLKGSSDVKEAMLLLARKHPEWKLHLTIASGHKATPDYNSDSSTLGFTHSLYWDLTPEEMRELYYDTDFYISSAWYEGFGLPTIEAMACGVPVIQVDNKGLDGIVHDGQNCLMIPPQNSQKMAEALEVLIKDHELRDCLIKNGLETASGFSLRNQYEMFVKEFESILNCKFDGELVKAVRQELECGTLKDRLKKISSRLHPHISVLVPTYNQEKYLPEALDSLVAQTYGNWEAIVVNDGSTDETPMVMERYAARDPRIRLIHKEKSGISSALNEGLRYARGEWICWLSPDNLYDRNKLAVHIRTMEKMPQIKFFHSHYYLLDGRIGIKRKVLPDLYKQLPSEEFQVLNFFLENYIHGNSVLIHRSVFDRVGNFNEELQSCHDFDMWLRISALYRSYFINDRTCVSRLLPGQGTDISTEKDISDSARAYLEFLNNHEFSTFFPALDLSNAEHALLAVEETLMIAINPDSFINRCGCASALVDSLHEWLTNSASTELKSLFKSQLVQTIKQVQSVNLTEETKVALQSMHDSLEKPFRHKSRDPHEKTAQHSDGLEKTGEAMRTSVARERLVQNSQESSKQVPVKKQPLFSIIVPTYNQAEFLPVALDSILSQTYGNWEAVVVNDGSTDQTAEMLKNYTDKEPRIRVIHKTNGGVASAFNEGIKNARGEWICWLSSDDMFEPDKLEVHLQAIKDNPDIRFFHTNYFIFDETKGNKCVLESDPRDFVAPVEYQVLHYFDRNCANGISVAIHREVFDKVGYFNEEYKYGQDFDMWLRINLRYRAFFIDQKTVVTRWHDKRGTSSFPEAGFYDSARACIEFLNTHKFSEFFPEIDLVTSQGAAKAIKETMAVVFNINAMMYKCYFNTSLLERLAEWLTQCCPDKLKQSLIPYLQKTIKDLKNSQLPEEVTLALSKFSEDIVNNCSFIPHNFSEEAAQYAKRLLIAGDSQKAESIKRYLSLTNSYDLQMINEAKEVDSRQKNIIISNQCFSSKQDNKQYEDRLINTSAGQTYPLVSILMPAYNASEHIKDAIESVLSQNYTNYEIVIVDDGSTDDTKEIVDSYKDDRIRYFYKENAGSASARNMAVKQSKGSFIIILDSDDMITTDFITKHVHEFEKYPETDLVYCDDCLTDKNGEAIKVIEYPEYSNRKSLIRDMLRSGYPIVPFRTCIRKSVFDKIGLFDESLPVGEDYDMMRRFVKQDMKIHHLKGALYLRRMGFDSLSRNYTAQKVGSLFKILRRFVDTFTYDELFPDVAWEKIIPERRQLHGKCLVAATYLSMAQVHVKANSSPLYIKVAFGEAWSEINECMKMDPDNYKIRELLDKCELGRKRYDQQVQQAVV